MLKALNDIRARLCKVQARSNQGLAEAVRSLPRAATAPSSRRRLRPWPETLNLKQLCLIGALTVSLAACATTPPPSNTMAQARAAWEQQDYEKALILMHAEAQRGNPQAQYALGYMYYNGQGTAVNIERAMHWINRAAEQGHRPALQALSQLATIGATRSQTRAAPEG